MENDKQLKEKIKELPKETPKSEAKRIYKLLKKQKELIRSHRKTVKFKEPVVMLIRRSGRVEFYENATAGQFEYEHCTDRTCKIILSPEYQLTFDYGDTTFKGYILHEDNAFPLPEKPLLMAELFNIALDKVYHDVKTWKTKEIEAKGKLIWYILIGIAIIILSAAAYTLFAPQNTQPQVITEVVEVVRNGSNIVRTVI